VSRSDGQGSAESSRSSIDDEEAERIQAAVEVVAEMQLTAEQLKVWGQEGTELGGRAIVQGAARLSKHFRSISSRLKTTEPCRSYQISSH
jgi:hypothetical protein